MNLTALTCTIDEGVARLTLAQPERGNPIDAAFAADFATAAEACAADPAVRAVLIEAQGKYFSLGGDLNAMTRDRADLPPFAAEVTGAMNRALLALAGMKAPVVCAVHGMTAGGAVSLVAAADIVLASTEARFYAAFAGIGIVADCGGTKNLPRRMGLGRATEFILLNQNLSAEEAAKAGLVNRVVAPEALAAEAWGIARQLADGPPLAFGEIKALLAAGSSTPLAEQLEAERAALARLMASDDVWNAINAVKARRKPVFEGR